MATKRPFLAISGIQIPSTGELNITNTSASLGATSGALIVAGGVGIGGSLSIAGRINIFNGSFYTALVSSASSNILYTLPSTTPSTGSSVLQSDTSGNLSWVAMTATSSSGSGITSLNSIQVGPQFLVVGTSGSTFNISSSGSTHTFNIPIAGVASTGLITTSSQTIAGQKTFTSAIVADLTGTATTSGFASTSSYAQQSGYGITAGLATTATYSNQAGYATTSGLATTATYSHQSGYAITSGISSTSGFATTAAYSYQSGYGITAGTASTSTYTHQAGYATTSGTSGLATTATYSHQSGYGITAGTASTSTYSHQSGYGITAGTATTSRNINTVSANTSASHYLLFSPNDGGSGVAVSSDSNLTYNPSTNVITANIFSGNVSATAVTSTNFFGTLVGNFTGTSTTSQNINVISANTNSNHLILFTPVSGSASGVAVSTENSFLYNPSTDILSTPRITVTSSTASTSPSTGALLIAGGLGVSGQLSFANAALGFTGITTNPSIAFIGATSSAPITLTVQTDNSLSWEGTSGQLFSIDNNLSSGEIFSVSDISGLPLISASAGQTITLNEFGGYTQVGNGLASTSTTTGALRVVGGLGVTGNVAIGGTFIRSSWTVGETINTAMYNYSDLSMAGITTITSTTLTRIGNITYTPKSSSSYIWIEFHANYDFVDGSLGDDFWSSLAVNGTEIAAINQRMVNSAGGGTRSGTLFPISTRYTNSTTSGIAITVQAKRGTADDNIRVYGSSTSGYMRIQEIGR